MEAWGESLPNGHTPSLPQLAGLAIITSAEGEPPTIQALPAASLPFDPKERFNALFNLGHLCFAPGLALKSVNLRSDADFSSQHASDFTSDPTRRTADPRVHEDMTVLWRRCTGLEVVEERLLRPEDLDGRRRVLCERG